MPILIPSPTLVPAEGNKHKVIEEFVGRVSNNEQRLSIARMLSPAGWAEPAQTPDFDEYTVVLKGVLQVESENDTLEVAAGQGVLALAGEWVRYSSPGEDGAEYISVCIPAFSSETVNRAVDSAE